MYRQGDVLFIRGKLPDVTKLVSRDERNRIVVAEGEATGHAHAIHETEVLLHEVDINTRWLEVLCTEANVVHEEHATITLPIGVWRVAYQREYTPERNVRVLD